MTDSRLKQFGRHALTLATALVISGPVFLFMRRLDPIQVPLWADAVAVVLTAAIMIIALKVAPRRMV